MPEAIDNETYRRILTIAEELFAQRGYSAVTLRDVAEAVDMKHASLYYYVPGGKESLFVRVMEHSFQRHQQGVTEAIEAAGEDFRQQLYAVADWFVSHTAMDLARFYQGDRPALPETEIQRLSVMAYDCLRLPILAALKEAVKNGDIEIQDFDLAVMAFVSIVQSVKQIPLRLSKEQLQQIAHQLVDMLLDGWRKR